MIINEIVLKVTNICNLNCSYCYVFNQADDSYKRDAPFMSEETMIFVIKRIYEHCKTKNIESFLIIFHGGEPLLLQKNSYIKFRHFCQEFAPGIEIRLALQTNGTLLSEEWIALFKELDISVGVSLDGTESATKNRIFRSTNKNAYSAIIKGINLLHKNDYPVNILSVINPEENPTEIYHHLKENNISFVDFLFPDETFENRKMNNSDISNWLIQIFDLWDNDYSANKPMIRTFEIIMGLILGVERGNEMFGSKLNKTVCIKPNGNIQAVDNLMVCGNEFTKTKYSVLNNTIDQAIEDPLIKRYYYSHSDRELGYKCQACIIKRICGGGHLAHRYSSKNGFDNPSAYCSDIFKLVMHIQNKLIDEMPSSLTNQIGIQKITLNDCSIKG
ncbi:MAG: radical SAM protein [Mangrovibacterium sp.]